MLELNTDLDGWLKQYSHHWKERLENT